MMARRMMRKHHVRCRAGEKVEITSKPYLSLSVLVECGWMLVKHGYKVKVLNTINFKKSMNYNPFAYIRNEKDILKLVNTIIMNTKGEGQQSGEDFWVSATCSQLVKRLRTT